VGVSATAWMDVIGVVDHCVTHCNGRILVYGLGSCGVWLWCYVVFLLCGIDMPVQL
jgi:hypothetical protein